MGRDMYVRRGSLKILPHFEQKSVSWRLNLKKNGSPKYERRDKKLGNHQATKTSPSSFSDSCSNKTTHQKPFRTHGVILHKFGNITISAHLGLTL